MNHFLYIEKSKAFPLQGSIQMQGLSISVENRKGSVRKGEAADGTKWRTLMKVPYGYIKGVLGRDKDHLDCFVGDNKDSEIVFVINQVDPLKKGKPFDEHKVMLGFDNAEDAKKMYLAHYDRPDYFGSIRSYTMEDFKQRIGFYKKGVKKVDGNTFRKANDKNDFNYYIDLEKAQGKVNIKGHLRKTKSGKITDVKQHTANVGRKKKGVAAKNPWIKKYGKLKLTRYPDPDIKPADVKIDTKGDIHSKAVMVWRDKKTNNLIHAYTKEYMDKKKEEKYNRTSTFDEKKLNFLKQETLKRFNDEKLKREKRESYVALFIIAETGLRVGSKRLLEQTGNKGLTTAAPNDFKVVGDTVKIKFKGKSYQDNVAEVKNKKIADFIKDLKEKRKGEKTLFDVRHDEVGWYFKQLMNDRSLKTKDLRTYTATKLANEILMKNIIKNLPEKKTARKRLIKQTLKNTYEEVARKLNNTPNMAKNSYISPEVIDKWLDKIGVEATEYKSVIDELNNEMNNFIKATDKVTMDKEEFIEEHEELVDTLLTGDKKKRKKEAEKQKKEIKEHTNKAGNNEMENKYFIDIEKAQDNELSLYIDFEKAHVKNHIRKTKSGKLSQVKDYNDSRRAGKEKNKLVGKEHRKYEIANAKPNQKIYFENVDSETLPDEIESLIKKNWSSYKIIPGEKGKKTAGFIGLNPKQNKDNYQIYHNSFSSATSEAHNYAERNGLEVDEDEWFNQVSTGYPGKPKEGETRKFSIPLKGGKGKKEKYLHFQVYGMENGKYELNSYIEKSQDNELSLFIDLEKARVKAHARKTKTGKLSTVKEYTDSRTKKQQIEDDKNKQIKQEENNNKNKQEQQSGQNQQSENPQLAKLQKEREHLQFMQKNYPDMIDQKKTSARIKEINEVEDKVNKLIRDVEQKRYEGDSDKKEEQVNEDRKQKTEESKKEEDKKEEQKGLDSRLSTRGSSKVYTAKDGTQIISGDMITANDGQDYVISIKSNDTTNAKNGYASISSMGKIVKKISDPEELDSFIKEKGLMKSGNLFDGDIKNDKEKIKKNRNLKVILI